MSKQLAGSVRKAVDIAQQVLDDSSARKALTTLGALVVLHLVNRTLSQRTVNNWKSVGPWNAGHELVLVTGGCSGIGQKIMEDLVKTGVKVVILDIQEPKFELDSNVFFYKVDVTSTASIKAVANEIRGAHGDPTVLVNNAGVGYDGTILEEPEEKIQATFQVNTISHFWMAREFLPSMIKNNHGHVITIASMASFASLGEMVDYSCSKASALAFHEGLAQELRLWYKATKVRTSIVHPNWVRTPMIQQLSEAGGEFKQPIMGPEVVSAAVVKQIVAQKSGQVIIPASLSIYSVIRALPTWVQENFRSIGSRILKHVRDQEKKLRAAQKAVK